MILLNKKGIGAKLTVYTGKNIQASEQYPVRGYLSSVDTRLHFGIGKLAKADSVKVALPDGKQQVIANVKPNTLIKLDHKDAITAPPYAKENKRPFYSQTYRVAMELILTTKRLFL